MTVKRKGDIAGDKPPRYGVLEPLGEVKVSIL